MQPIKYIPGNVISSPGIYDGVHIDTYHGQAICDGPSISSSGLRKIFSESPAHFYCDWSGNPEREPDDASAALILGSAAHHLLLGEDDFSTRFIMRPAEIDGEPWQGNKKICKAWLAGQAAAGRTVLTAEQVKTIRGMAKSLAAHPLVKSGILNGAVEQSMFWKCKDTGLWKKARPDCIPNASGDFVDLKTTISVQDDDLRRTIYEHGYHQQGALVCEGWAALTGEKDTSFTLVFVEKAPPYCVRIISLTDEDMTRGERQNYAAIDLFARCLEANEWPGPGRADAEYMHMPEWATKRIDYHLDKITGQEAA